MKVGIPTSARRLALGLIGCGIGLGCAEAQTAMDDFPKGVVAPRGWAFFKQMKSTLTAPKEFRHNLATTPVAPEFSFTDFHFTGSHGGEYFVARTHADRALGVALISLPLMYPPSGWELLCGLHGVNDAK
jgi:hypothetical protein